ncbi:hypothetical protein ILUMI_12554 [Ignelater luminosus]|uniref:Uncharacterized protein n=1 Tax=Ignelater luminosus TaxID=2038154 RepID=A0A8K0CTX2_IGNLU|nr:hypothetical protein ILUMI_12554 [Ignelater luminosus]
MATQKNVLITRQSHRCPLFGLPKELSGTGLPTYEDVLLCLNCKTKDSSYGISHEGEVDKKKFNAAPSTSISQVRIKLPATASIIDKFGVSDRATAAIASSVIQDLGMIPKEDMSLVIDKSKIRRENQKARKILQEVESVAVLKALMDEKIIHKFKEDWGQKCIVEW